MGDRAVKWSFLEEPEPQGIKPDPIPIEEIMSLEEWASIMCMRGTGLPPCCANVSALRDRVISIFRDGYLQPYEARWYVREFKAFWDGHDLEDPDNERSLITLLKKAESLSGFTLDNLTDHINPSSNEQKGLGV